MLTPTELPHYTYADYAQWEGRWELIEGIPFAMTPSPTLRHQLISQAIASQLSAALAECEKCRAVLPVDWKVAEGTIVQPDNMVICYQPTDDYLTKAPSLIFEILSPSTEEKDRQTKFSIYEREGVSFYCIVDPENSMAEVYRLNEGRYLKTTDATDETLSFDLGHCLMEFDFSSIWKQH